VASPIRAIRTPPVAYPAEHEAQAGAIEERMQRNCDVVQ
jgi:hypothetical protein